MASRISILPLALLVSLIASGCCDPGGSNPPPEEEPVQLWGTDGGVNAMARSDDILYIGGVFTKLGPKTGPVAALGASDGLLASGYKQPKIGLTTGTMNVTAIVVDGGTVYAGGNFTHMGGLPHPYLAAIDTESGQPW